MALCWSSATSRRRCRSSRALSSSAVSLLYAVRVDTSEGFELCPADACQGRSRQHLPGLSVRATNSRSCRALSIRCCRPGRHFWRPTTLASPASNSSRMRGVAPITYDINTNTNYNPEAEAKDGRRGMGSIARYLHQLLGETYPRAEIAPAAKPRPEASLRPRARRLRGSRQACADGALRRSARHRPVSTCSKDLLGLRFPR